MSSPLINVTAFDDLLTIVTATSDNQVGYDFDFLLMDADDIKLIHINSAGVRTTYSNGAGFSVAGLNDVNGGTCNLTDASGVSNGDTVIMYSDIVVERLTNYTPNGEFSALSHETEVDKSYLIVQQLLREITRAVKLDYGKTPPSATTAQLADVTHAINTGADKVEGYMVLNLTTGLFVFANGSADADTWKLGTGTVAHTPV